MRLMVGIASGLALAIVLGMPAFAGYYNSQGQWCEGANNTLCEGATSSSSSGGGVPTSTYDPDLATATAIGQVLGVLLNAVIEEGSKEKPAKTPKQDKPKNPSFCTDTLCYPMGDPARYPIGSRQQFEAVCAMSNAENKKPYLNYKSIGACADAMMIVASYPSTNSFNRFAGSELPGPESMFQVPEIPDDGAYSATPRETTPQTQETASTSGASCSAVDEQGRDCVSQTDYKSEVDDHGNTTYRLWLQNSCDVDISVSVSYATNPSEPKQTTTIHPGDTDGFTCNDWANGGSCGGFGNFFQKCVPQ